MSKTITKAELLQRLVERDQELARWEYIAREMNETIRVLRARLATLEARADVSYAPQRTLSPVEQALAWYTGGAR